MATDGITVNVSQLLEKVQLALSIAKRDNDAQLKNAAESVLSALVLVMRRKVAVLPPAMGKYMHTINEHVYTETGMK